MVLITAALDSRRAAAKTVVGVALALMVALAGCRGRADTIGSYPAVNKNDCLPDITLVDQHGQSRALSSLKGEPVLLDFIYTSCRETCPILTARMAEVEKLLGPELGSKVRIVSITLDPEHDHPAELLSYARMHGAENRNWLFLTGTPAQVEQVLALFNLKRERNPDGSVQHMTTSFLLGPDGHQLRIYDVLTVHSRTLASDLSRALAHG